MPSPETTLRWDPGKSNWKRHHRRYVGPIVKAAAQRANEGLLAFGIEPVNHVLLSRAINTNRRFGVPRDVSSYELYIRIDDIRHRKLERGANFFTQLMVHEPVHCKRLRYFDDTKMPTISEHAVTEGFAYCVTQQFAALFGYEDAFDRPIDFIRSLPASDMNALQQEIAEADERLGVIPMEERGEGSDYDYHVQLPCVGIYSGAEAVGIYAIASLLDKGYSRAELMLVPPRDLLQFSIDSIVSRTPTGRAA